MIRALLGWFIGGSVLATLAFTLLAVGALVLGLLYRRYLHILGADRNDPGVRQAYDGLRDSFAQGNVALRLNAKRLTRLLNWTDHFFCDASLADHTLFPHAFGLKTPAPLWTAPAFDRCLLLALVYAVMVAILIWTISGSAGAAEQALHLAPHAAGWIRLATVALLGVLVLAALHLPFTGWFTGCLWAVFLIVIAAVAGGLATAGVTTGPGASELVQWSVIGVIAAVAYAPGGAVSFAFGFLSAVCLASEGPVNVAGSLAVVGSIVFAFAVRWANSTPIWRQRRGTFLIAFFASAVLSCLVVAYLRSSLPNWNVTGPLVLVFGLLTLIDAALDWASLGLARALLRRGLELGGRWPYALALVNAGLAAFVIAALALIMVVGVQAFDALAVHGGGAPTLPLEPLFNGIAKHPSLPEYWWFYAVLLSTMIPSLVNLVIGGTSLVSGLPGVPSMLLRYIPERGGVLKWNRRWIATVLTGQVAAGAALGIAAQVFLTVVIIGYVMPFFGLELLDMARDVATFNLPARVGQIFGVSL